MTLRSPRAAAAVLLPALCLSCSSGPESGRLAGWNVVVITIDTLRADHVGFSGYREAKTPALDGLAGAGVVFEDAVSAAPITLPSHATILTGRYPPGHGALDNGFYSLPGDVPTLASVLRGAGYRTGAVVGAYVLHGQYGLDSGFDYYDDFFRRPRQEGEEHRERSAEQVTSRALDWLDGRDGTGPFLLWAHYYDPHAPYDPPDPFRLQFATRPYDGEIAYTDREVGRLLDGLRDRGLRERTLVVVAADHGEAFGDGGEKTHGLLLRNATLHVPLLFCAPGALPGGRRVAGVVSTADVTPTVLDLLGQDPPPGMDGSTLLPEIAAGRAGDRTAYSETRLPADMYGWSMLAGVRTDEWAWVRAPLPELYDRRADPSESRSLHEERPDVVRELDGRVSEILGRKREAAPNKLSAEEMDALRALGYVMDSEAPAPSGADPKERLVLWNRVNDLRALLPGKRFAEIETGLRDVLREDPGNREARMLLGQALVGLGRYDEGIREFRTLIEGGWFLGRSGILFARTLAEAGRPDEAEALLRGFLRTEPEFAEHAYNLGVLLLQQERFADAREAFERAHELNPEAIHVLANLGVAISRADPEETDAERAISCIDRAIALSEESDRPLLIKAEILGNLGRREEALEVARELAARPRLRDITAQEVAQTLRSLD